MTAPNSPTPDTLRELAARWKRRSGFSNGKGSIAYALGRCADELLAILDAEGDVRKDAERYRWLRSNCKREWQSDMPHNKGAPSLDIDFSADGHDLDAAIDAAMQGDKP
jgi:hypothetical protein